MRTVPLLVENEHDIAELSRVDQVLSSTNVVCGMIDAEAAVAVETTL